MRYTGRKGWQASKRDVWSVENTLCPIIGATVVKYREESVKDGKFVEGVPVKFCEELVENDLVKWEDGTSLILSDEDERIVAEEWLSVIDKIVYAFTAEEPDIMDYNFSFIKGDKEPEKTEDGFTKFNLVCTNKKEQARYIKDGNAHYEKVEEGYKLFGKWLRDIWL